MITLVVGPAWSQPGKRVGVVVTRSDGRKPSKRDVSKFEKALRRSLTKEGGWKLAPPKQGRGLFQVDRAKTGWRCRADPVRPEDVGEEGRVLHEDELFCALEVVREAGLDRLLLVHLDWSPTAYDVHIHHIRVDLGRVVGQTSQQVPGKSVKPVVTFASALAKRATEEVGGFRLETNVEGADVEMDGMFLGRTPLQQSDMAPGAYKLKITADGYFDWEGEAEVTPGKMSLVEVDLQQPRMSAPLPAFSGGGSGLKWGLVGLGAAAAVGGLALAATQSDPTARAAGIALFAGGVGGAIWAFTYEF